MKMENETATLLFKKLRYHVMHNQSSDNGLLKNEDFRTKSNLQYLAILTSECNSRKITYIVKSTKMQKGQTR